MSYLKFSTTISEQICEDLDFSEEKREVITYAIENLLLTILGFSSILLMGFLLNAPFTAVIAGLSGGLLRKVSGGAHFNTALKCMITGAIVYSLLGLFAKEIITNELINFNYLFLTLIISLIIVSIYAPVDSKGKPIISQKLRRNLRISSIIFVLVSILIVSISNDLLLNTSIVLGILCQSVTLFPIFNKRG